MASHCGDALDYTAEPWLRLTVELDGIWPCDDSIEKEPNLVAANEFRNVFEHLLSNQQWVLRLKPFMRGMVACCGPLIAHPTIFGERARRNVLSQLSDILSRPDSFGDDLHMSAGFVKLVFYRSLGDNRGSLEAPEEGKKCLQDYIAAHSEDQRKTLLDHWDELTAIEKMEEMELKERDAVSKIREREKRAEEKRAMIDSGSGCPSMFPQISFLCIF